jgi:hypothetical protein
MAIQPPFRTRLPYLIGGFGMAAALVVVVMLGVILQHENPVFMALAGVVGVGLFAGLGYMAGGPSALRADSETLSYHPSIGQAKTISRKSLSSIARVLGLRGLTDIEFRAHDGKVLLTLGGSYTRPDMERFSAFLGVPLRWEVD